MLGLLTTPADQSARRSTYPGRFVPEETSADPVRSVRLSHNTCVVCEQEVRAFKTVFRPCRRSVVLSAGVLSADVAVLIEGGAIS
eukprot:1186354-Prorocentrum_minimum.AAC.1